MMYKSWSARSLLNIEFAFSTLAIIVDFESRLEKSLNLRKRAATQMLGIKNQQHFQKNAAAKKSNSALKSSKKMGRNSPVPSMYLSVAFGDRNSLLVTSLHSYMIIYLHSRANTQPLACCRRLKTGFPKCGVPTPNGVARPFPEGRGMASGSRGRWGRDGP